MNTLEELVDLQACLTLKRSRALETPLLISIVRAAPLRQGIRRSHPQKSFFTLFIHKRMFYIFHLTILAISLYVADRLIWHLPIAWWFRVIGCCLLVLIAQQHLFYRFAFGGLSSPTLPPTAQLLLLWLFVAMLLLLFLYLGHDLINALAWLSRRLGHPFSLPCTFWQRTSLLAILALLLSGFGLWQGLRVPDVRTQEITLPGLPKDLDGVKIVQLTDLHVSALLDGERLQSIVERTNALQPDLILITGDIVDGKVAQRGNDLQHLAALRARYGVFSCLGNHEYYSDYLGWLPVFDRLGLHMLKNSHQVIQIQGQAVVIAGITDLVASREAAYGPEPDIQAALKGAPAKTVTILMAHQPKTAKKNAEAGVDLQLSGHTHGGHVRGLDLVVQWANESFVRGLYQVDQMQLYVSSGAGLWTGFPVRLGVPSEISCIILRSDQK